MVFADLKYFEKKYMYGDACVYASTCVLFFHYFAAWVYFESSNGITKGMTFTLCT
jgi:hypothetical protein